MWKDQTSLVSNLFLANDVTSFYPFLFPFKKHFIFTLSYILPPTMIYILWQLSLMCNLIECFLEF